MSSMQREEKSKSNSNQHALQTQHNQMIDYIKLYQDKDYTNPKKLLIQIILLQVFYYLSALIIFYIVALLNGYEFSIDWIFQWQLVSFENTLGLTLFALWLFDSLTCVLFVTIIVGRSKLAWDFAVTIHIINLIITWCYVGKFPRACFGGCYR